MATLRQIRATGRDIVKKHPGGIRYAQLVALIQEALPDAVRTSIAAQVANHLVHSYPNEIAKPSRGLYQPIDEDVAPVPVPQPAPPSIASEEDLYAPFAEYLKNDLEEATDAVPLGGAGMKAKWGTPDVVGVYRPLAAQLIKFSPELVAAEIKLDPAQPVVAFGQAIAYRLFAARTYVVMPSTISEEDESRLEALSMLFGFGFVLFDPSENDVTFSIRVRAQRFSPRSNTGWGKVYPWSAGRLQ